jgi:hypothetical protein
MPIPARIAAALRLLADAIEEGAADTGAEPRFAGPAATPALVKKARTRRVRNIDPPPLVDEVTARRAEMALRRAGVYRVKP